KAKTKDSTSEKIEKILTDEEKTKLMSNNFANEGAKGKNSIAIGYSASTEKDKAENAIALGNGAKATAKDSIVLG
ncbi:hypothetical protein, partial [Streptobacillus moniliformis]|uniref:hypothetical protein n=1 Tax=Streptobacillus moniliformis TaxID=34105 RepID=UPI0012DA35F6